MDTSEPTLEEWKALYETANEFKQMRCWEWFLDEHIFGVQNPESGEIGYCCILGNFGEMFGMTIYLGSIGLQGLHKIRSGQYTLGDSSLHYMQNCLMASFENRSYLSADDLKMIKTLGLKFRGAHAWPSFRSYEIGMLPWQLTTASQVRFLTLALQQAMGVAQRYRYNPDSLILDGDTYIVMVPERKFNGVLVWSEESMSPNAIVHNTIELHHFDELRLAKLKRAVKMKTGIWEIDCFYSPSPVSDGGRPYFPKLCLVVDQQSEQIIHFHLSENQKGSLEFAEVLLQLMEQLKMIPQAVCLPNEEVLGYFDTIIKAFQISPNIVPQLPAMKEAKDSMLAHLRMG